MRKLLVFVIVLLVIVVGVDIAGRAIAESKAGEAIARQANITPAPDVDIHGLSFLWQAIGGHYGHISITSSDLSAGPVSDISGTADLRGVDLSLSDVIGGDIDQLTAQQVDVTVGIPLGAVAAALRPLVGDTGTGVELSAGDDGAVVVSTVVTAGGSGHALSVALTPQLQDGTLTLGGGKVVDAPAGVPTGIGQQLASQLQLQVPLGDLPFDLTRASVRAEGDTLLVRGSARNLPLGDLVGS